MLYKMSTALSIYSVYCLTESNRFSTDYRETVPTTCPNNNAHTIDPLQTIVVETINNNIVKIDQGSSVTTGNHFRVDPYKFVCGTGPSIFDVIYPYNVSLFNIILRLTPDNVGDTLRVVSRPDTVIGMLVNPIITGDTSLVIPIPPLLNNGFLISITDGVNTDDLGEIVSFDINTNTITFSTPAVNNFAANSLVRVTIEVLRSLEVNKSDDLILGQGKFSSVGQIKDKITRVLYTNNGVATKNLTIIAQIYY